MVSNGTTVPPKTQPSIRSFFHPRTPSYTQPPVLPLSTTNAPEASITTMRGVSPSKPLPKPSKTSNIPPQAIISPILPHHIQPLRRINSLLLPVNYPDSFYHRILEPHPDFNIPISLSRVICWSDDKKAEPKVIGGIVCRLDPSPASSRIYDLYVQSLALLSPYRSKGLASALLKDISDWIRELQDQVTISSLYAHVWTGNSDALTWYQGRGFVMEDGIINGYYRRLKPDTAWVLRRKITPSDLLSNGEACATNAAVPPPSGLPNSNTEPLLHTAPRPSSLIQASSFQDRGPDREWNDLPEDVLAGNGFLKAPPGVNGGSGASSRSTSRSEGRERGGKKKRQYPAAAFGDSGSG